jgi:hypothetical protein
LQKDNPGGESLPNIKSSLVPKKAPEPQPGGSKSFYILICDQDTIWYPNYLKTVKPMKNPFANGQKYWKERCGDISDIKALEKLVAEIKSIDTKVLWQEQAYRDPNMKPSEDASLNGFIGSYTKGGDGSELPATDDTTLDPAAALLCNSMKAKLALLNHLVEDDSPEKTTKVNSTVDDGQTAKWKKGYGHVYYNERQRVGDKLKVSFSPERSRSKFFGVPTKFFLRESGVYGYC